ncbi:unnamed protein product [Prorocentrum cordatum]|uniref:Phospholipase B-like n=1 Tax=Prorocentrum cordatum TaxID=2364126 RepID=A0ABN9PA61_9DINO|nr:unnamed protein product [Polarella glacialis]
MFAVRRDVLSKFSPTWYDEWRNVTYASVKMRPRNPGDAVLFESEHDGFHHDFAMMEVFPILFATTAQEFPAWLVSPSTVDLFDTVDAMKKFSEADRSLPLLVDSWQIGYNVNRSMYANSSYVDSPVRLKRNGTW